MEVGGETHHISLDNVPTMLEESNIKAIQAPRFFFA